MESNSPQMVFMDHTKLHKKLLTDEYALNQSFNQNWTRLNHFGSPPPLTRPPLTRQGFPSPCDVGLTGEIVAVFIISLVKARILYGKWATLYKILG